MLYLLHILLYTAAWKQFYVKREINLSIVSYGKMGFHRKMLKIPERYRIKSEKYYTRIKYTLTKGPNYKTEISGHIMRGSIYEILRYEDR